MSDCGVRLEPQPSVVRQAEATFMGSRPTDGAGKTVRCCSPGGIDFAVSHYVRG
jgi:hypothetical protein